ncbi:MAG: outer membrane protein assembly factor BamA [Bacteroidales bacterium]|nr:outer membrane protein assembly factor BamA [Bacteroidales bacterium]
MRKFIFGLISIILFTSNFTFAQKYVDYNNPKEYYIADISVSGIEFLSKDALIMLSGLNIGQKITIPGDEISSAIDKLWGQGLFSDVKISIIKTDGELVFLDIYLQEQPRLSRVYFYGINSSQESDLREKLELKTGKQVTNNVLRNTEIIIKDFYADKGFPFVDVNFKIVDDTLLQNVVNLHISIDKKNKVKIKNVVVRGNEAFPDKKVKRILKETKEKKFFRFWKPSKFVQDKYKEDKKTLINKYNQQGYRDARITVDSVYNYDEKFLNVYLKIDEGTKYYFRNIEWVGNTKYTNRQLSKVLDIKKGDPYNQERLQNRLYNDMDAVGNLYYDDGYLFFQAIPQEVKIENDSVDVRILIAEGQQAKINRVLVNGNTRSNEYVIRRELRTLPGQLFSRSDLIRSVRELANLGNFDPEQLAPVPIPNQNDGSVDIRYDVVERPNDMFELSGGWSAYGFMGQVGITFNNFSMQNIFKPKNWDPIPMGDGQKFSISARVGGPRYQLYSLTFVEPWLGGKKPNSFSTSVYYNHMTNSYSINTKPTASFDVIGLSIGLGKRLKWPDDYFVGSIQLSFDKYIMDDYQYYISVGNGSYNILSSTFSLSRSSTDNPLYTRSGSDISFALKATPPYSLIKGLNSWQSGSDANKYKWAELYKFNVKAAWYNELVKNLVLSTRFEYGLVGYYNKNISYSPFEGFVVGGDGMAYYTFGKDYIGLRGYENETLTPANGAHLYSKYTVELRYPLVLKDMATLYVLGFLEGGNAWYDLNEFNPFSLYRSSGVGARLFIPMLGLVGIDVGYGFDEVPNQPDANGWNYHIVFGQQF